MLNSLGDRVATMPRQKALRLGERLGRLGYRVVARSRKHSLRNLRLVYGDTMSEQEREAFTCRVFETFGRMFMDFYRAALGDADEVLKLITRVDGWDEIGMAALAEGKGVIAVSGHIGNFELFARYVGRRGVPLTVVARDPDDPIFGALVKRVRQSGGYEVQDKGKSARALLKALGRQEVIGILHDQNSGDVFVPFFGVPAGTPTGPAILALKTGAPIVPAYCVTQPDGTYRIIIHPIIRAVDTGDRDADLRRITEQMTESLEQVVREYPEQWLWLHNRWKASFEDKNLPRWPSGYDLPALQARWNGE